MIVFRTVLRRIFRPPSHATVVAYLALFMAMSGTAYAATKWTGTDIVDGSLSGADVGDNSLTGADITAGSISTDDLAPGTLESGGGISATSLLGSMSSPAPVTGPYFSTDGSAGQVAASVEFSVPEGESYHVLVSAQGVITGSPSGMCPGQTTWTGGQLAVFADGGSRSLLGFLSENLPGGATGGSQVAVFGPGDHTIAIVNRPSLCTSVSDPGTASISDSFLTVNLLAVY